MGISHSTARWIAPASFIYDFIAQQYGINSTPSMKEIHDRNLSFFSPQPYFIAGFFFPQQLFQLAWLYRLFRSQGTPTELSEMTDYAPIYALGNLCIGTWMFFWNASDLKLANIFVIINTISQIGYLVSRLKPMNTNSTNSILTHVVSKTFAGIGVLDLLHNTSVGWFVDQGPSMVTKVATGLGFALASSASDWIFGGCLVYDLIALAVGQSIYGLEKGWGGLLGVYAVGAAAIVGAKNWKFPPYEKKPVGYEDVEREPYEDTV